jgi:hypothetical protein
MTTCRPESVTIIKEVNPGREPSATSISSAVGRTFQPNAVTFGVGANILAILAPERSRPVAKHFHQRKRSSIVE